MGLQPLVEVVGTGDSIADGKKDEYDGDDREECERSPCWQIERCIFFLVHTDQLEQEICEGTKVEKLEKSIDVSRLAFENTEHESAEWG